jgi:hypothetical protein
LHWLVRLGLRSLNAALVDMGVAEADPTGAEAVASTEAAVEECVEADPRAIAGAVEECAEAVEECAEADPRAIATVAGHIAPEVRTRLVWAMDMAGRADPTGRGILRMEGSVRQVRMARAEEGLA